MAIILDYTDYVEAPKIDGGATYGSSYEKLPNLGYCPYCKITCKEKRYTAGATNPITGVEWMGELYRCGRCGWWDFIVSEGCMDDPYLATTYKDESQFRGILKSFDLDSYSTPVDALIKHIKRNPKALYSVNPKKMEEIVQSVLSEFYDCEVKHVGQTGDGGIDLLVANSDKTLAVQVKRRTGPGKTETVQLIREFLGAIQLEGLKEGIIVSTADRFTKGAVAAAERAIKMKLVHNYKLIDFPSFVDMVGLARGAVPSPMYMFDITDW
jgi:restriction system protein